MKKKYVIEGLGDSGCPLCINGDAEGRKEKRPPVFQVSCEGGYSGCVCAPHLAALIKAAEPSGAPAAPPRLADVKPAQQAPPLVATALPANGPAEAVKK